MNLSYALAILFGLISLKFLTTATPGAYLLSGLFGIIAFLTALAAFWDVPYDTNH